MTRPVLITGSNDYVVQALANWITLQAKHGVQLFALEGLMGSGKTTTAQRLRDQMSPLIHVRLDDFFDPRGANTQRTWDEALMHDDVVAYIKGMIKTDHPVLVDGAIAWPTVEKVGEPARRLYLKRMQFPEIWADESDLTEYLRKQVFRKSVRDYHAQEQPWTLADVVVERLVGPDGE